MSIELSEHFTYKKLIKFTLPTIVMMIFSSIYGIVDGLFVSNCVGSDAFAAVNLIMPALMIFGSVGFMIGTGGSAIVSKTLGEGDNEKANKYFSMLIYLLIILGTVFSIIGIVFLEPIAIILGAEGQMINYCVQYGRILLVGLTAFLLQNCFQSFLVVAEMPTFGLVISVCAGITNMILDFLLIYVFKGGVIGAALATTISQIVGGIIPLVYFIRKNKSKLKLVKTKFSLKPIVKACTNGSSEMVTNLSLSLVNMLYNIQLMKYAGTNGVVAYGIIMYVGFIFIGTYLGYSIGSAPIVGYHYGANNLDELKGLLKKSLKLIVITSIIMTGIAEIFAKPLASIFVSYDKELLEFTTNAIRIYALSYIVSGINIFTSGFFTALNDGVTSAVVSFIRTLVFQVGAILILPLLLKTTGIWLAVVVAEILSLIVSFVFLVVKRKKYKYA